MSAKMTCECADSGCPENHGAACEARATVTLWRVDMIDASCAMCEECAEDALASGLFSMEEASEEPTEPEEDDIVTEDLCQFYLGRKLILDLDGDADHVAELRAYMERVQYWPNVWQISDHGNAHLIDMPAAPASREEVPHA